MSKIKRALYLQFAGLGLAAGVVFWATRHYPVMQYIIDLQQKIGAMEFWGAVLYPLLYATCNVLLLPGGVLAIGSGLFFGIWWGFFLNVLGNVGGAAVSFFLSRKLGRNWVKKKFLRHQKWVVLDEAIARDGWKIIFLSQVHPLFPSSLLNYLYGVTRIRFRTCMLWIALGQTPGLFLYAYLGTLAQHGIRIWQGKSHPHTWEYGAWLGGFLLTVAVTIALGRLALRLLAEAEKTVKEREAAARPSRRLQAEPAETGVI
jgi:uncharacterized membrane protein YdjX (TVP38/TMEM64 family)